MWHQPPYMHYSAVHFYSHISARCDRLHLPQKTAGQNFYSHISARCDSQTVYRKKLRYDFYSHISARCDPSPLFLVVKLWDFYSHISARCDIHRKNKEQKNCISTLTSLRDVTDRCWKPTSDLGISTLTSLRDVTDLWAFPHHADLYFYSHISARCDNFICSFTSTYRISTLTSLRDVTLYTVCCLR